ncbi:hypothetical protein GALMADRAFT_147659 [Galerina marginata CBS 339.88]|uniref:Uncharacterized protein n=1 Tax=Galerina marginata (strain CBS 339.88) TaxID=685588 RepID=A0A067S7H5_GALM3|nr:hypothetical protein GALMADRAFT_147659 [Galerina marginata CBS 339.88]
MRVPRSTRPVVATALLALRPGMGTNTPPLDFHHFPNVPMLDLYVSSSSDWRTACWSCTLCPRLFIATTCPYHFAGSLLQARVLMLYSSVVVAATRWRSLLPSVHLSPARISPIPPGHRAASQPFAVRIKASPHGSYDRCCLWVLA